MRLLLVVILMLAVASTCAAGPVAVFTPDKSSGIDVVTAQDGQWEYKNTGGRRSVTIKPDAMPTNWYLYFKLDAKSRERATGDAWIAVDFFDSGIGTVGVQYNGEKNPYEGKMGFLLLNSQTWRRALVHLPAAKFAGLQNAGADLRLDYRGPLAVARLEVYSSKPKLDIPTDKERVMKSFPKLPKPKGMYYTFGCNGIDDSTAVLCKCLGVTSIESYVTWETCEGKAEGQWDWSQWDKQVQVLKDNGLKWVPFLILGPAYSTPGWFRASSEHVPCRCLEHEQDSKIESRWNPNLPKRIDRFISEFAKRYGKSGVIESVLLGIQGDFGEAIYSVTGGGWTFNIPGEYHNHPGYWCGDSYALKSFREAAMAKYGSLDAINKAWGTSFASQDKIDFPGEKEQLAAFQARIASGDPQVRRRWLDFVDWYRAEMTDWSDWWMATTRKHFPDTPIYLCTGGDAEPRHGSNFAEQCRVAAKHNAGVRITNEASDYASNFVITRWVASAGKHYGAYFGFEPAGEENELGIVARIYNATASGANQLHDYSPNVLSSKSRLDVQRDHLTWLFNVPQPVVPVALWYPNVSMTLDWGGYFEKAKALRDLTDYDFIDETMLHSSALNTHRILVIVHGKVMQREDADRLAAWIMMGGRAIVMGVPKFESVEGASDPETTLFGSSPYGRKLGDGAIRRVNNEAELVSALRTDLRELGLPVYDLQKDGIFGTQIASNRFLFLNTGSGNAKVRIEQTGKTVESSVAGGTIAEVEAK